MILLLIRPVWVCTDRPVSRSSLSFVAPNQVSIQPEELITCVGVQGREVYSAFHVLVSL